MVRPVKRHVHRATELRLFTAVGFAAGVVVALRIVLGG